MRYIRLGWLDRRRVQFVIGGAGVALGTAIALTFGAAAQDEPIDHGTEAPATQGEMAEAQKFIDENPGACETYLLSLKDTLPEADLNMPTQLPEIEEVPTGYRCESNNLTSEIIMSFVFQQGELMITNSDGYLKDTRSDQDDVRQVAEGIYISGDVSTSSRAVTSAEALIVELER